METYYKNIKNIAIFEGIKEEEIENLLKCLEAYKKKFLKNQTILSEGDIVDRIGIVLKGSVSVFKIDYFGNTNIITALKKGETFAEVLVCADIAQSPVNVQCIEDSEILFIDFKKIISGVGISCEFHQKILGNMLKNLAKRNLLLNQKINLISKRDIRSKVLSFLNIVATKNKNAEFEIQYDRQSLADYLCVDRSALSRVLSELKKEGIIDFKKNKFKISNPTRHL